MAQLGASTVAESQATRSRSDGDVIPKLIQIGSDPKCIKKVQAMAAKTMKAIGYKYPKKACAATLSHFLNEAGINVPVTTGAQNLADRLRVNRHWDRIKVGKQQPGDVGVCYSIANDVPGADHVYLVVERKDSDLMIIADNQAQGKTHTRYASGKGGKTPTEYFLRAPQASIFGEEPDEENDEDSWPDEDSNDLPEPFMDDGSPRLMDEDGSPRLID
ncbi:hypothetical protein [Mesorhizobium temperatum]|uniref:Uncharacterized protein n=1 Tax=Mesorhizobium temperatum TaxID=241416 RepID=A0A271LF62_9HYPH|nr:hypothetical protein [Mesorhizobium temperatum]PAQ06741.1 hypothetical protein CIT26_24490 [Mesorhizobium temperatum]